MFCQRCGFSSDKPSDLCPNCGHKWGENTQKEIKENLDDYHLFQTGIRPLEEISSSSQYEMLFQEGQTIHERYLLGQVLGSGGTGQVFKAYDLNSNHRVVALKRLAKPSEIQKIRSRREFRFLSKVQHPSLIKAYDYFELDHDVCMILEFARGKTMGQLLQGSEDFFSLAAKLSVANKVARAIQILNTGGILHRDIKPDNIMIHKKTGHVKLLDLGLGKDLSGHMEGLTIDQEILGTIPYLSPEQAKGESNERSDIFSLGVTLYQFFLWDKTSPFYEENSLAIVLRISRHHPPKLIDRIEDIFEQNNEEMLPSERLAYQKISNVLEKSMEKKAEKRWASAQEMANEFAQIQEQFLAEADFDDALSNPQMLSVFDDIDNDLKSALRSIKREVEADLKKEIQLSQRMRRSGNRDASRRKGASRSNQKTPFLLNPAILISLTGIILLALLFLFSSPSEKKNTQNQRVQKFFIEFKKEYTQENYSKAWGQITKICDFYPDPIYIGYKALMIYFGQGVEKSISVSAQMIRNQLSFLTKREDSDSLYILANLYDQGIGVEENITQSIDLYRRSANLENALAMINLGLFYYEGRGVNKDHFEAAFWFKKAANLESGQAMNLLALMYWRGEGVEQNSAMALDWYEKAIRKGNLNAYKSVEEFSSQDQLNLDLPKLFMSKEEKAVEQDKINSLIRIATIYFQGNIVEKNYKKAMELYQETALQGSPSAMFALGSMFQSGQGVLTDLGEGVSWYEKAAERGSWMAAQKLCSLYLEGTEVNQNFEKAKEWLNKAGQRKENLKLFLTLAEMSYHELKDYPEAIYWYKKAASLGNIPSIRKLVYMYSRGQGAKSSYIEARRWLHKGAEVRDITSIKQLATMYLGGIGGNRNKQKAIFWLRQAAELGDEDAKDRLQKLQK